MYFQNYNNFSVVLHYKSCLDIDSFGEEVKIYVVNYIRLYILFVSFILFFFREYFNLLYLCQFTNIIELL